MNSENGYESDGCWGVSKARASHGAGDWDGLPSPEALIAFDGYKMLQTDQNGWIHLSADRERMWVEAGRR